MRFTTQFHNSGDIYERAVVKTEITKMSPEFPGLHNAISTIPMFAEYFERVPGNLDYRGTAQGWQGTATTRLPVR